MLETLAALVLGLMDLLVVPVVAVELLLSVSQPPVVQAQGVRVMLVEQVEMPVVVMLLAEAEAVLALLEQIPHHQA